MKSSVVICAYTLDRWITLDRAVRSCTEQTCPPDEVILVIDYNEELLQRAQNEFPEIEVIANSMSKGLSGARNTGVRAARGDVIVFLDDDARGDERWLEKILEPFADPAVVGCGGWSVPEWLGERPRWCPQTFLWIMGCSYEGLPATGATIRNPIGANMALRRRVFDLVGGFSAGLGRIGTIPLGCEETELCIRYGVNHSEDRFVMVRESVVFHSVPASRTTWDYFFRRCWSEGLSKAAVASLVGGDAGLSAERRHLAQALPRELVSSVFELRRHPLSIAPRLFSIVAGSAATVGGFLWGSVSVRRHPITPPGSELEGAETPGDSANHWREIAIVQVDLDSLPDEVQVPGEASDRVWLEVVRNRQVVARLDVNAVDHVLSRPQLEEVTRSVSPATSSFPDVAEDQLPPISIVVPTIAKDITALCATMELLSALDYPQFEVVIVDNRVTPGPEIPALDHLKNVVVVRESIPGISAARNRGVLQARFDIVAFTDDDVEVDDQWLRAIGGRFSLNPEIDALGGLVLPARLATEPQLWFEEYFGGFSNSFELRIANQRHHPDDALFPYQPSRYAAGCNMALRKEMLHAVGGFRLSLGTGTPAMGGEDLEMFMAVASRGGTIAFEPSALVHHIHRSTEEQFLTQTRGYGVGLTAAYVSLIVHDPRHLGHLMTRLLRGVRTWREARPTPENREVTSYPAVTSSVERRGLLAGPLSYFKSQVKFRRMRERIQVEFGDSIRV